VDRSRLAAGISALDLFVEAGLTASKSEARRLVQQGGASINGRKLEEDSGILSVGDLAEGAMLLKAGKKRICRVLVA
jgi:tyrosyl-tRNA synthetase